MHNSCTCNITQLLGLWLYDAYCLHLPVQCHPDQVLRLLQGTRQHGFFFWRWDFPVFTKFIYIPLWVPSPVPVATPGRTPRPPNPDQRRRDKTCNLFCKRNLLYWYIVYFTVPLCIYLSYVWYVSTYLGLGQIHLDRVQARQFLCDIILTQKISVSGWNFKLQSLLDSCFCVVISLPGTCFDALPPLFTPGPPPVVPVCGNVGTERGKMFSTDKSFINFKK